MFLQVKECLPPEQNLAKWLGEILSIDASNVYRRIRGDKPLKLSELNIIARNLPELPLILERIWGVENRTYALLLELKTWQEIQQYLKLLQKICRSAGNTGQPLLSFDRTAPLPLLFGSPQIMKMSLAMMRGEDLGHNLLIPDPVKRQLSAFLFAYERAQSTELWYLPGVIGFLERVVFFQSIGMARDEHLWLAKKELISGINRYFRMAEEGVKARGGRLELLISEFALMDSMMITVGSVGLCFGNPFDSIIRYSQDPRVSGLMLSRWQHQRSASVQAGKLNRRLTRMAVENVIDHISNYGLQHERAERNS